MLRRAENIRLNFLIRHRDNLAEQLEAIYNEIVLELDKARKVLLDQQVHDISATLVKVEAEIGALTAADADQVGSRRTEAPSSAFDPSVPLGIDKRLLELQWRGSDPRDLVRYIYPQVGHLESLPEGLQTQDVITRTEAVYSALRRRALVYDHAPFRIDPAIGNRIRSPLAVFQPPRTASCVDLALLFCGLCIQIDLHPLLLLVEGHVFVAVSIQTVDDPARKNNADHSNVLGLQTGHITDPAELKRLITLFAKDLPDDQPLHAGEPEIVRSFLPIECEGFTISASLSLRDAVRRGYQRLTEGLQTALDTIVLSGEHGFCPDDHGLALICMPPCVRSAVNLADRRPALSEAAAQVIPHAERAIYLFELCEILHNFAEQEGTFREAYHLHSDIRVSSSEVAEWPPPDVQKALSLFFLALVQGVDALQRTFERFRERFPDRPSYFQTLEDAKTDIGRLVAYQTSDPASIEMEEILLSVNLDKLRDQISYQEKALTDELDTYLELNLDSVCEQLETLERSNAVTRALWDEYAKSVSRLRARAADQAALMDEHRALLKIEDKISRFAPMLRREHTNPSLTARLILQEVRPACALQVPLRDLCQPSAVGNGLERSWQQLSSTLLGASGSSATVAHPETFARIREHGDDLLAAVRGRRMELQRYAAHCCTRVRDILEVVIQIGAHAGA